MAKVLEYMDQYCIGQTNVIYERYCFNNRNQEAGEVFDTYLTALKALSKTCKFGTLTDELIRDRIVCGIRDTGTRKKLLQEAQLTLQRCIDMCRSVEVTKTQVEAMSNKAEANVTSSVVKDEVYIVKDRLNSRNPQRYISPQNIDCKYCGRKHENLREKCIAFGRICKRCGKKNHFAVVCNQWSRCGKGEKRESVKQVMGKEKQAILSDDDDEYCLVVNQGHLKAGSDAYNSPSFKEKIFATMKIGNKFIRFQVDSGATCNVINKAYLPEDLPVTDSKVILHMFNGAQMTPCGKCCMKMMNPKNGKEYETEFVVVEDDCTPILGSRSAQEMNLLAIHYENIAVIDKMPGLNMNMLLEQYGDVFKGEGKLEKELHLEIDETVSPEKLPVRRVPVAMKAVLKEELDQLENLGIIKPVNTPTDWVSSLVVAKKPNGKLRICIDPKPLNKALKRSLYPLPVIDDLLPDLVRAKVFSVCDVKNGFWHIRLDEQSSFLTTFGTPFGRYRWTRMPFGIAPAPECFQQRLDQAIEGLPGVRTVADDILISGKGATVEEAVRDHDKKLVSLLERCREKGLKLNKEKFKLKLAEIPYVGHLLTPTGLKPDPSKVEAVRRMPRPTDVKGVQRVIGLVNYLARFLVGMADVCEPLRQLTRQDVDWQWKEEQESAFEKIKELISSAPVLRYFDPSLPTCLQCDASDTGLGASLMQNGQPIAYASRSLSNAERNYAQIEKELLAIVFAAERFNQYTYGRKVIVESDHKPLEIICKKPLVAAPKRLQRMLMRLQKYDLEVCFKSGKQMFMADTLSRAPIINGATEVEVLSVEEEIEGIQMAEFVPLRQRSFEQIRKESEQDTTMQALARVIRFGWSEDRKKLQREVMPYFQIRDQLSVQDGVVYFGNRCVIPVGLRASILSKIHRSHIGVQGCLQRARESVYWPGMNAAVKELVSRCEICRSCEIAQPKETLVSHGVPSRPWGRVAVDLFELDQKQYLVTVDYFSNFWEVDCLGPNGKSRSVIEKLRQQFARHGIPDVVMSDNGPHFASSEFKAFAATWEFRHNTSSPGYPQSNGMVESAVKTAKRIVKKAKLAGTDPWLAILDYRNTPTEGMSSSPVQRLMSRRTRTTLPAKDTLLHPHVVSEVAKELRDRKSKQRLYYNRNARDLPSLKKGDIVRVQPLCRPKESWLKARVQRKVGTRSYEVYTDEGGVLRRNRRHLRRTQEKPVGLLLQNPGSMMPTSELREEQKSDVVSTELSEQMEERGYSPSETEERRTRSGRVTRPPVYLRDYVR